MPASGTGQSPGAFSPSSLPPPGTRHRLLVPLGSRPGAAFATGRRLDLLAEMRQGEVIMVLHLGQPALGALEFEGEPLASVDVGG